MGDIKGVGRREEVTLISGAVVVRGLVWFQQGRERELGRALFQALGIEVQQEVQLVFNRLHLKSEKDCVSLIRD